MSILIRTMTGMLMLCLFSCQEYGIQLRVENASPFSFDKISVNNVSFGSLESYQISRYLPFESIYKSEFISVEIGDQTLKLIPETFNEEEYYNTGNFKFVVDILNQKWLLVKLEEE